MRLFLVIWAVVLAMSLAGCAGSKTDIRDYQPRLSKPAAVNGFPLLSTRDDSVRAKIEAAAGGLAKSSRFKETLARSEDYVPYIADVFIRHGLPLELCYLPLIESKFDPDATSRTGARGMWQFTEETARDYGMRVSFWSDERTDWKRETHAAAQYLAILWGRYGNWELALAAYNAGPGYIDRRLAASGKNQFWGLSIKDETAAYVPLFLGQLRAIVRYYPGYAVWGLR